LKKRALGLEKSCETTLKLIATTCAGAAAAVQDCAMQPTPGSAASCAAEYPLHVLEPLFWLLFVLHAYIEAGEFSCIICHICTLRHTHSHTK
jgi:hypothetical protein